MRRADWVGLAILFAVASIRFVGLGEESFWLDEAKGARFAFSPLAGWWEELPAHHAPPGYFLLERFLGWFSVQDGYLRFPSALAGFCAVFLLWNLVRRIDRESAFPAALLLAVSPLHFLFSREARVYSIWVLAELIVFWLLLEWRRRGEDRRFALLSGLVLPLPLLLHYHALWFLVARVPLVYRILRGRENLPRTLLPTRDGDMLPTRDGVVPRRGTLAGSSIQKTGGSGSTTPETVESWTPFLGGAVLSGLLSCPWLIHQVLSMPPANPRVTTTLSDLGFAFWNRKVGELFGFEYPLRILAWTILGLAVIGVVGWLKRDTGKEETSSWRRAVVFSWIFPVVAIVASAIFEQRYIATRHLLPALPFLLWSAITGGREIFRRSLLGYEEKAVYALTVGAVSLWTFGNVKGMEGNDRPPWRDVSFYLERVSDPGSFFLAVGDNVTVIDYYRETRRLGYDLSIVDRLEVDVLAANEKSFDGVVVAGEESGGREAREALKRRGVGPSEAWTSRRIGNIEYYSLSR